MNVPSTSHRVISELVSYIFNPIMVLGTGIADTTPRSNQDERLRTVRYGLVILVSFFVAGTVSLAVLQNSSLTISSILQLDFVTIFGITFALYSVINLIVSYRMSEDRIRNTIFTSSLFVLASLGVLTLGAPEAYVIVLAVLYGMGSYVDDRINFENPYPGDHIDEELKTAKGVIRYGIGLSIPVGIGIIGIVEYSQYLSQGAFVIGILFITALGYVIPKTQMRFYENLYKHRNINTPSHFWILPSKLGVIVSSGMVLMNGYISIVAAGFFAPAIFGILFATYVRVQKTDTIMGTTYRDSDNLADPLYVNANKSMDIETEIGDQQANIDMSLNISVPEDLPDSTVAWQEFLKSTNRINQLMSEMSIADNTDDIRDEAEEFQKFYDDVAYQYYLQRVENNDRIPVDGWCEELIKRVRSQIHRCDSAELQDIYDLDVRLDDIENEDNYTNIQR